MILPFFEVDQNDDSVIVEIKIPHIRFNKANVEIIIEDKTFIFALGAYYLRLELPFSCVDDEKAKAIYDSKKDKIHIEITKQNKGEFFPDLDIPAKLLARLDDKKNYQFIIEKEKQEKIEFVNLIEDLDKVNVLSDDKPNVKHTLEDGFQWTISKNPNIKNFFEKKKNEQTIKIFDVMKYGFNNLYDKIVGVSILNGNDINELIDPENMRSNERVSKRIIMENIKFDIEYYLADYAQEKYLNKSNGERLNNCISWKSTTSMKFKDWKKNQFEKPDDKEKDYISVEFSMEEKERMNQLPKKSYLVDEVNIFLFMFLVSSLFAYHFDLRENEGEHNVESAWTVGKLIPQFSFLDSQMIVNPDDDTNFLRLTIITSIKRALSYPLHRNYSLITKVWEDVYYNIMGGKRFILKSLLDLKELFRYSDIYYVYDKIWLEDFCSWFISDQVTEKMMKNLSEDLFNEYTDIKKSEIIFEKPDSHPMIDLIESKISVDHEENFFAFNLNAIEAIVDKKFK